MTPAEFERRLHASRIVGIERLEKISHDLSDRLKIESHGAAGFNCSSDENDGVLSLRHDSKRRPYCVVELHFLAEDLSVNLTDRARSCHINLR